MILPSHITIARAHHMSPNSPSQVPICGQMSSCDGDCVWVGIGSGCSSAANVSAIVVTQWNTIIFLLQLEDELLLSLLGFSEVGSCGECWSLLDAWSCCGPAEAVASTLAVLKNEDVEMLWCYMYTGLRALATETALVLVRCWLSRCAMSSIESMMVG